MTAHEENPTETLTFTDTFVSNFPELTETLTLTDTFTYNWTLAREYTETLTLTDSIIRGKNFSETLTLSDGDAYGTSIELEETLTLTDSFTYNWDTSRTFTDTLTLTDIDTYATSRELTETLTLTDGDITDTDLTLKSTNGAWCGIFSSRISLGTAIQNFINELDAQQIPINMMRFSCHAVIAEESTVEFNVVAIIKKH